MRVSPTGNAQSLTVQTVTTTTLTVQNPSTAATQIADLIAWQCDKNFTVEVRYFVLQGVDVELPLARTVCQITWQVLAF
eukprot:m.475429 g.475429  ORF g.475429 m.475429 type:complete len:79 (-) comp38357_c0_seq1:256-492(-)